MLQNTFSFSFSVVLAEDRTDKTISERKWDSDLDQMDISVIFLQKWLEL